MASGNKKYGALKTDFKMQWTDEAILLSCRKLGENKAVARVFSAGHGVFAGVVRGAFSKANRGILQPGNAVNAAWNARLSEQLGAFRIEPLQPFSAYAMADKYKLAALTSACALLESALPERHPYPKLYGEFYGFLEMLCNPLPRRGRVREGAFVEKSLNSCPPPGLPPAGGGDWLESYVKLELEILAQSGFGLDLHSCAATGSKENLAYVSPKSGRAVSAEAGEPYKERLLRLPSFLTSPLMGEVGAQAPGEGDSKNTPLPNPPPQGGREYVEETLTGLRLTGYFLDSRLTAPHGKKLPVARKRLLALLG